MIFPQNRDQMRAFYRDAWLRERQGLPVQALEAQIIDVIRMHPEYHAQLEDQDAELDRDYHGDDGQSNPFLHMGLHLSVREQLSTDRPAGFSALYKKIADGIGDVHSAEHLIMETLAETLWLAQQQDCPPDQTGYIERLQEISRSCSKR